MQVELGWNNFKNIIITALDEFDIIHLKQFNLLLKVTINNILSVKMTLLLYEFC